MSKMLKILYLHGLESEQGGPKVDFLSQKHMVCAPKLDYKDPYCFQKIRKLISNNDFDLIIGSSMGGYLGFTMGELFEIPTILFNPALHSRSFEPVNHFKPKLGSIHHEIYFGINDDLINPEKTKEYLEENDVYYLGLDLNFAHSVPLRIFINSVNNSIYNLEDNGFIRSYEVF